MQPEEVIVVLGLCVFLPLAILSMVFRYKERRHKYLSSARAQDSSLTTSELEAMIEDAVGRALDPIAGRLSAVERKLDTLALPAQEARGEFRRLASSQAEPEAEEDESPAKTVGRRRTMG